MNAGVCCSRLGIALGVIVSWRFWAIVLCFAALAMAAPAVARAQTQAVTPYPLTSGLPIVGDPHDARASNLVVLDSIVFVIGVGVLGGILVWWGLRIYREK